MQPLQVVPPGDEGRHLPALPSLHPPVSPPGCAWGQSPEAGTGVWELGFAWPAHGPAEAEGRWTSTPPMAVGALSGGQVSRPSPKSSTLPPR